MCVSIGVKLWSVRKPALNGRDINNSTGHYKGAPMNACVTLKRDPLEDCSVAILRQAAFFCLQLSVNKRSAETSQAIYMKDLQFQRCLITKKRQSYMHIAAINGIFCHKLRWRKCTSYLTQWTCDCTDLHRGGDSLTGWLPPSPFCLLGTIFTLERTTTTERCHSDAFFHHRKRSF